MSIDESVDDLTGVLVDVEAWVLRVRRLCSFVAGSAVLDDLDAIAPDISAMSGWMSSLRSQCAGRRMVLSDEAVSAGRPSPDHGDPEAGHGKHHRRSRRASAKDLERERTMAAFPALRGLLSAGTIGIEHIDVVTGCVRDLTAQQVLTVRGYGAEIAATAAAAAQSPERFRVALRQLLLRLIDEDGLRRFERQRRTTRLQIWTDPITGMVKVYGEFDPERGAIIANRIQGGLDVIYALPVPPGCPDDPLAKNDHLRALALIALLRSDGGAVSDPAGGGPDQVDIDMVVVVDFETLRSGKHEHSIIDAGPGIDLPVETLRRLACCANIIPAVLGSDGVLLDQGREARLANRRQRRALRAMYPTCAITGCDTRFDHCKIHHIKWWDRDLGATDLANLLPLCHKHHYLVHEGGWLLTLDPVTRVLDVRFPDGTGATMHPPRAGWNGHRADDPPERPPGHRPGAEAQGKSPPDGPSSTVWPSSPGSRSSPQGASLADEVASYGSRPSTGPDDGAGRLFDLPDPPVDPAHVPRAS